MCSLWLGQMIATLLVVLGAQVALAANGVGGSLDLTSDYVVRGVSHSNGEPAAQADLHIVTASGLLAGLSASTAQPSPADRHGAELSAFAGYAWRVSDSWRARVAASYYAYPSSQEGSQYNYTELAIDAAYSDWLNLAAEYSPDAPQYAYYQGLRRHAQRSAEAVLHTGWHHRLAASAGGGYSESSGPSGGGYPYWSVGALLDLAPLSLSLRHLTAGSGADSVSYGRVARHEWVATLLWRF